MATLAKRLERICTKTLPGFQALKCGVYVTSRWMLHFNRGLLREVGPAPTIGLPGATCFTTSPCRDSGGTKQDFLRRRRI
jgi:hypothetical protein